MIAVPKAACRFSRADPVATNTGTSVMLRALGVSAGPWQIDHRRQPNEPSDSGGASNHRRPHQSHHRPPPRTTDKSP
jgi:hypothetical protein